VTAVEERQTELPVETPVELPYDGQPTFSYQPKDGSEPIVFPKSSVLWEESDGVTPFKFLWKIRKMNQWYQSYEFMDRAKVPDEIQERVVDLSDAERRQFFDAWFSDLNEPPDDTTAGLPPE
jgi:hypothetical protein